MIAIFDNSRELENDDKDILELLKEQTDKHIITILNKSDLEPQFKLNNLS